MQVLAPGVFQVINGEIIIIDVRRTGTQTLFGVNYSIFGGGGQMHEGHPVQIRMDKSKATGASFVPGARSAVLGLVFSFNSNNGGRYDLTLTGSDGGSFDDFAEQAGNVPAGIPYTFHIV